MIKKLLTNSAIYGIAPQIPQIANIIILPIITQDLTKLDYGVAGIVYAYLAALGAFQFLGLNVAISNGYFHYPSQYKWLWRQIHGFVSLWSLIYAFLVGFLLFFVIPDEAIENKWTIVLLHVIPCALLNVTAEYGRIYYILSQKPLPLAIQVAGIGIITIFLNLYFISFKHMGYMGWFWSRFIGSSLTFMFFFYPIYLKYKFIPIFNFKWRLLIEKLKVSIPMIPHKYGRYLLASSDKVVMDLLQVNIKDIGIYNLAGNFGNYFSAFAEGSGMATTPIIYEYYQKLSKAAAFALSRKLVFLWQAALIIFSFTVCLWFKEIFFLLIKNDELQAAYPLAIIIIMGYNYRPIYGAFIDKLFYYEKATSIWKISFTAGVLNIILNVIFIPFYGIEAAAITTFVASLYLGVAGFFIKEYKELQDLDYYPFYWVIGISLVTLIVFYIKDIYWLYKLSITIIILMACFFWIYKNKKFLRAFDL